MSLLTRARPHIDRNGDAGRRPVSPSFARHESEPVTAASPPTGPPGPALPHGLHEQSLDAEEALREAPRLYHGRTLEELIPRIVAELGPDAVVLRHERGLTGGFAGFFRRPFVELEAERGLPRFDRYDEEDEAPALPDPHVEEEQAAAPGENTTEYGYAPAHTSIFEPGTLAPPGDTFAAELASAEVAGPVVVEDLHAGAAAHFEPRPDEAPQPEDQRELPTLVPSPAVATDAAAPLSVTSGPVREALERALLGAGVGERLVREVLEAATAHVLPLLAGPAAPALAVAVRRALAQRIPVCPPLPAGGAVVAFVGPGGAGKSACCAALLAAYHRRSTLPAACAALGRELDVVFPPHVPGPIPIDDPLAAQALARARGEGLLVLDTPPLSPADERAIAVLAAALEQLAPDRVVLALPATLGAKPAARLVEVYRPLGTSALAVTHAEETDQLGVAVQIAHALGLAPAYLLEGSTAGFGLAEVEPADLAGRLLPPR
jgi:flagellar biosynthesis GTPase FlhF